VSEQADVQDIDARLWQDPFAAVAEKLARLPELRTKDCPPKGTDAATGRDAAKAHCISPLDRSEANDAFVLVASVSAAPYSEDHEARRRTRYAVLAGLNAEGYVPVDPQHIGFYRTQAAQLPQIVPYEWFKLAPGRKSPPYGRILLLWFDEDALRESPLKQFAELLCPSTPTPRGGPRRGFSVRKPRPRCKQWSRRSSLWIPRIRRRAFVRVSLVPNSTSPARRQTTQR